MKQKKLMTDTKLLDDWLDNAQPVCTKTDGITKYDFSNFTFPSKFASKIYNKNLTLQEAEDNPHELEILINKLKHAKNLTISLICSGDMFDKKILQSDSLRKFWPISLEQYFPQIWVCVGTQQMMNIVIIERIQ